MRLAEQTSGCPRSGRVADRCARRRTSCSDASVREVDALRRYGGACREAGPGPYSHDAAAARRVLAAVASELLSWTALDEPREPYQGPAAMWRTIVSFASGTRRIPSARSLSRSRRR